MRLALIVAAVWLAANIVIVAWFHAARCNADLTDDLARLDDHFTRWEAEVKT